MPIAHSFDSNAGVIRSRAWGELTTQEMLQHIDAIADDPSIPRPLRELWDGSRIHVLPMFSVDVHVILEHWHIRRDKLGPVRLALVASNALVYGMARMAQTFIDRPGAVHRIGVFREPSAAESWLQSDGP